MDFFYSFPFKRYFNLPQWEGYDSDRRNIIIWQALNLCLDLIKNIFTDDFLWLLIPIRYRQRYQDICHSFYGITQSAQSVRKLFQHVPQV